MVSSNRAKWHLPVLLFSVVPKVMYEAKLRSVKVSPSHSSFHTHSPSWVDTAIPLEIRSALVVGSIWWKWMNKSRNQVNRKDCISDQTCVKSLLRLHQSWHCVARCHSRHSKTLESWWPQSWSYRNLCRKMAYLFQDESPTWFCR